MHKKSLFVVLIGPIICFLLSFFAFWIPLQFDTYTPDIYHFWFFLAGKIFLGVGFVWLVFRFIDMLIDHMTRRASLTEHLLDKSIALFIGSTLKVLALLIAAVIIASNMGHNVTGLVAGLGIGGLAIALAAQESLSNLFGSIVIFTDRPFKVGEWIVFGDSEGIVESVGFRSTRIRTFYGSLITIPNGVLSGMQVDNMGVREFRRTKTMISVTYGTPPSKIEAFCAGIRELILNHPFTRKDLYHVWFKEFGDASLNIELIVHFNAADYANESRERHRLFLDIMRLAQVLEIEFAFPTQTIYMGKEPVSEPVFPESGKIVDHTSGLVEHALVQARKIAASELGGTGVSPEPFHFEPVQKSDEGSEQHEEGSTR